MTCHPERSAAESKDLLLPLLLPLLFWSVIPGGICFFFRIVIPSKAKDPLQYSPQPNHPSFELAARG